MGDLEDPDLSPRAPDGVGKVFLLGGFAASGVLRRIRAAGARHVVLLTSRCVIGGNPQNAVTRMWLDAEAAVRDSGVAWTILRPSGFRSNALRWLPQLREGGVVRAPWPAVPIATIDSADIAAVASVCPSSCFLSACWETWSRRSSAALPSPADGRGARRTPGRQSQDRVRRPGTNCRHRVRRPLRHVHSAQHERHHHVRQLHCQGRQSQCRLQLHRTHRG
jgi:hypothetical protein